MTRVHLVKFLVTKDELDRIKKNSDENGFGNLSGYMRHLALHRILNLESQISDMHRKIMTIKLNN